MIGLSTQNGGKHGCMRTPTSLLWHYTYPYVLHMIILLWCMTTNHLLYQKSCLKNHQCTVAVIQYTCKVMVFSYKINTLRYCIDITKTHLVSLTDVWSVVLKYQHCKAQCGINTAKSIPHYTMWRKWKW